MINFDTISISFKNCNAIDYRKTGILNPLQNLDSLLMNYGLNKNKRIEGVSKCLFNEDPNGCFYSHLTFSSKTLEKEYKEGINLSNYSLVYDYINKKIYDGQLTIEQFLNSKIDSLDIKVDFDLEEKVRDEFFKTLRSLPFSSKLKPTFEGCKKDGRSFYLSTTTKRSPLKFLIYEKGKELQLSKNKDLLNSYEGNQDNLIRFELRISGRKHIQMFLDLPNFQSTYTLKDVLNSYSTPVSFFFKKYLLVTNDIDKRVSVKTKLSNAEQYYLDDLMKIKSFDLTEVKRILKQGNSTYRYNKYMKYINAYSNARIMESNVIQDVYQKIVEEESLNLFKNPYPRIFKRHLISL